MWTRFAGSWFGLFLFAATLVPMPGHAQELAPGDIVLFGAGPSCGIYRLDPVTLAPTQISDCLGFGNESHRMTVDRHGRLFVIDEVRGIVEVSPATGARSVLVPVENLGGPPRGIGMDARGNLLVTIQAEPPRLVRIDARNAAVKVVSEGGLLLAPTGVVASADGSILVVDQSRRVDPVTSEASMGALVRVDPVTGTQTVISTDARFYMPQDLVCVGGDSVWVVNRSRLLRSIGGGLTITRLSDGVTTDAPVGFYDSQGIARLPDGSIAYSGCQPVHGDCNYPYVAVYGSGAALSFYMGTLAVVPERDAARANMLAPASPNPFVASTDLSFTLTKPGSVELVIYSVDGRRVATLEDGTLAAGPHRVTWSGTDASGRAVRPGMYFARLRSAAGISPRTVVLIP